jgi:hypothetical protein
MQTQKYKNIINTLNESNIVSPSEEIEDDLLNHALSQLWKYEKIETEK